MMLNRNGHEEDTQPHKLIRIVTMVLFHKQGEAVQLHPEYSSLLHIRGVLR